MLTDDITIRIKAGDGGKGAVAFNKNMLSLGPAGGSGGDGASVYFEGTADLSALRQFLHKKDIKADSGKDGRGQFVDGKSGEDVILKVPVGTVVHILETGEDKEITKINERVKIAQGGHGGRGNFHFRSSTNTTPKQYEDGKPGQQFTARLELKLIADVGLIGLPNVGKSSLLNELTNARSKVGNYSFTTLEPNLGVYYDLILADLPGLIEGAASGKGLGIKFLRHVERTGVLFHLVSAASSTPLEDYATVRQELGAYNEKLLQKDEYVFLSKTDETTAEAIAELVKTFKKKKIVPTPISIHDFDSIEKVKNVLNKIAKKKTS